MSSEQSDEFPGRTATDDGTIVEFDPATRSATEAIVSTVSDRTETGVAGLAPMYDVIDPDALDRLVRSVATRSGTSSAEVTMEYFDHTVTVHGHGMIEITPRDAD